MRTYLLASTRALRSAVPCLGVVLTAVGCSEQNIEVEATKASVQGDLPAVIEDWSGVGAIGGVCSGVLIAPKLFVFAAHCGVPQRTVVFLDASEIQTIVELALGYCRSAAPDHDLAFCQVNGDEAPVTSIPFAPAAVYGELRVGDPLSLAGWGVPGGISVRTRASSPRGSQK